MPPKRCTPNSKKRVPKVNSKENLTLLELKLRYRAVRKQNAALDKEISELRAQGVTEDLKPEMQALHDYNDIKDVTQLVLGHLAEVENCTVAQLYKKYNLPSD